MSADMAREYRGDILRPVPRKGCAPAKVDVLEPDRVKTLVESADTFPNIAPKHKKRTGGLIHFARLLQAAVEIPVPPVHRIPRPKSIEAE